MSRLQALRDALRPLGIYKLEKGTLVYAELAAYAAGLDLLEDGLDELEREAFLPTAQGEGISRREEIYGKPKTLLPLRERREMLLYRGAINNRNNTREDLERALVACGLRAQVKENLDGASIYINCFDLDKIMIMPRKDILNVFVITDDIYFSGLRPFTGSTRFPHNTGGSSGRC